MTLHAAWKMDNEGASAARTEISLIKFFGASVLHDVVDRAVQIHGALGYTPTCRSRRCTATRAPRGCTTAPTRCTASRSPGACCAATSRRPTGSRREHVPTRREEARRRFADLLEAVTSND